ncbi:T9SS type A sorting domain-containing protein [Cryomorphaceae bacterium 1068]|nr:T9SS type A sorting domain-containing protein [Cryomorphaceae bacterium 1068]
MKYAVLSFLLISLSVSTLGQISHGGEPYRWNSKDVLSYENYQLPEVDLKTLQEEDAINDKLKSAPYRFGKNIEVDIDIHNNGIWTELENGDGIWRLALNSKEATSLNFVFDSYIVPEGGQVFIYTEDKTQLLGSFTHENTSKNNSLGVGLIFSDKAIIEYYEPANVKGEGYLHINNVTHGYRDILVNVEREEKGAFGNSDDCNINVNCPTEIDIDFQKRSVAVIVVNNNGVCSGAMVNNTLQDGTPFFLTANHCLPGNTGFTQNWIFYFNHETPGCSGNNGPTNQSISGGTLLSNNNESDYALLELNDAPPSSYNVCYSGWDATDSQGSVSSAYGIHHPSGDVKKICFEEDAPYHENIGSFVNQTWFIDQWEEGVTEGGSSGSPLFNQNGLLIGQLAGGLAACDGDVNNGSFDYYGRMGVSWTFGNSPSNAIRFYLDQSGSGTLIVPNSCNTNLPDLNASLGVITGIPAASCELSPFTSSVNVVNLGIETIEEIVLEVNLNGSIETIEWSGNIAPQEDTFVSLGTFNPSNGVNNFTVEIISLNGDEDTDELGNVASRTFEAFDQALEINVIINLDNYPGETTWTITNEFNDVIASGGPYTDDDDPVNEIQCLEDGCYDFTIFDSANDGLCCGFGQGSYSVVDQFGTILASGAEFGSSETTQICAALDTQNTGNSELTLFPNPATDVLKIDAGNEVIDRISLFDISGKLITEKNKVNSPKTFFNINNLPSGLYVVEVVGSNGFTSREKVVVAKEE